MIATKNLSYKYPGNQNISFPDITCQSGEKQLILGPSGCGKSTLLYLLGGLLPIQQGDVLINEKSLGELSGASLDKFRGQHIGIIFQNAHFVRSLNVLENLLLAQKLAKKPSDKSHILATLDKLNIRPKANISITKLSQGEQQRVAIARALINNPSIILADEPTSALDDNNTDEVINLLENQAKAHQAALLIVTHDTRLKSHFDKKIELS